MNGFKSIQFFTQNSFAAFSLLIYSDNNRLRKNQDYKILDNKSINTVFSIQNKTQRVFSEKIQYLQINIANIISLCCSIQNRSESWFVSIVKYKYFLNENFLEMYCKKILLILNVSFLYRGALVKNKEIVPCRFIMNSTPILV